MTTAFLEPQVSLSVPAGYLLKNAASIIVSSEAYVGNVTYFSADGATVVLPTLGSGNVSAGTQRTVEALNGPLMTSVGLPVTTPADYTVLARLKNLETAIAATNTKLDTANTTLTALNADTSTPTPVVGLTTTPMSTFSRPADTTAYTNGDIVANNTVAASVTPLSWAVARVAGGMGMIRRVRIEKSDASARNYRLHLYTSSPTVSTAGDNGPWASKTTRSGYLGSVDVTVDKLFSDGAAGVTNCEINFDLPSGTSIYGILAITADGASISGETFYVTLEVLQQ